MKIVDAILKLLSGSEPENNVPEGVCPNCWGKQEYGGEFYRVVKNHGFDASRPDDSRGWIQDYADKNFSHIQLHVSDGYNSCEKCKRRYELDK